MKMGDAGTELAVISPFINWCQYPSMCAGARGTIDVVRGGDEGKLLHTPHPEPAAGAERVSNTTSVNYIPLRTLFLSHYTASVTVTQYAATLQ